MKTTGKEKVKNDTRKSDLPLTSRSVHELCEKILHSVQTGEMTTNEAREVMGLEPLECKEASVRVIKKELSQKS